MTTRPTAIAMLGLMLVCGSATAARAQSAADPGHASTEISGGYAWLREIPNGGGATVDYSRGWVISGGRRLVGSRLLVVAEAGESWRTNVVEEKSQLRAFLAGPRYRIIRGRRVALYAQSLFGTERFSEPGLTQNGFALQPGAGIDWRVVGRSGLRVQADYRLSRDAGYWFQEPRVSISYVAWFAR